MSQLAIEKKFRICATATGGPVFFSWVQFDFSLFYRPANWTCEHYPYVVGQLLLSNQGGGHRPHLGWSKGVLATILIITYRQVPAQRYICSQVKI